MYLVAFYNVISLQLRISSVYESHAIERTDSVIKITGYQCRALGASWIVRVDFLPPSLEK